MSVKQEEVSSSSPFDVADTFTDVTFDVEGKQLHFSKHLLQMSSPVFDRMFTSDFKEKESSVIPLPGKTYQAMDTFLRQLHPAHCWKPITDGDLEALLQLADEYQVKHVQERCQKFMEAQISTSYITCVLLYLRLCDKHKFEQTRTKAIESLASQGRVKTWESCDEFKQLTLSTKYDLVRARCLRLDR
ncbi:BTB and MATH domain-containing protein 38-like [Littorina saxatilis]|uniref:BTB domain-containing protein n=1 Tax=Littorina saxatilis TaxID=31220 RepID=A0AAN9GRB3_9CAEN